VPCHSLQTFIHLSTRPAARPIVRANTTKSHSSLPVDLAPARMGPSLYVPRPGPSDSTCTTGTKQTLQMFVSCWCPYCLHARILAPAFQWHCTKRTPKVFVSCWRPHRLRARSCTCPPVALARNEHLRCSFRAVIHITFS
jgi:hypothetical protein